MEVAWFRFYATTRPFTIVEPGLRTGVKLNGNNLPDRAGDGKPDSIP